MFTTLTSLLLVIIGFSLVIFFHELGHFAAARWAGIRVFAFAVGFGPAIVSWRRGLGLRAGSSEAEYRTRVGAGEADLSPTEYRLNWVPFGGYVRMLGQEDAAPASVTTEPDSFTSKPVWKRMIVISAGVVMNVLLAGALFVVVFMIGMREVAPIIGSVTPGSVAQAAGLKAGDRIVAINAEPARTFTDLQIATAMSGPGESVELEVRREGKSGPENLVIQVKPVVGGPSRLMQIGVGPAASGTIFARPRRAAEALLFRSQLDRAGLVGVPEGGMLVGVNGVRSPAGDSFDTLAPLLTALSESAGRPVQATFRDPRSEAETTVTVRPELQLPGVATQVRGEPTRVRDLLGLRPLMRVESLDDAGRSSGLREGDVFLRIGGVNAPDRASGINAIHAARGKPLEVVIRRGGEVVTMNVPVSDQGRIGFVPGDDEALSPLSMHDTGPVGRALAPLGSDVELVSVAGRSVRDFAGYRDALKAGLRTGRTVALVARTPDTREHRIEVDVTEADVEQIAGLGWSAPFGLVEAFQPSQVVIKAGDPWHALEMGVAKTKRVLVMTYVTFARLFQGTVKVEHLKGPVGIASLGTQFAEEGFEYLLFFLALISANLAVVNFLPLPIVDGGLFLMLCYEGIARRPVPVRVQNGVTIAGLALIGTIFLVVTFHDVVGLFK